MVPQQRPTDKILIFERRTTMNALCDKCPYQKTCTGEDHCILLNEKAEEEAGKADA